MNTPIQKILFGSPGTGKSHRIDAHIIPQGLGIDIKKSPENVIKTVFHPEYTHSDFIGKLLPITRAGKVEYNFYEGHFLRALGQAYKNIMKGHETNTPPENVALVIDEINRGNSSAIFGSIFQLLDRDSNGESIGWSSYCINLNGLPFTRILEFIGISFSYDKHGEIDSIKIKDTQEKINFLKFDLINRTIKIPPNLSIIATMNTSDSSIYYMDSAFKRRWDWEFIDIDSTPIASEGIAFKNEVEWFSFIGKLNEFIKSNHKYIRGIEDKQIGKYFIKEKIILKSNVQSKLMFFLWDSVFARDKKPLLNLICGEDISESEKIITFGDFAKRIDTFISNTNKFNASK
jgi:5-methylcytosine-specific restriction endonuclease McrBC GTP-binding regulatory subunit McrB